MSTQPANAAGPDAAGKPRTTCPRRCGTRGSRRLGIEDEAIEQAVALAAGTPGIPAAVAAFGWVRDVLDG